MPCWSGVVKVVLNTVLFGVVAAGESGIRWKGESIENSSWRSSFAGIVNGSQWSRVYWEISIEYFYLLL